jgi:uncharacterized protein (DUF488 family)
MGSDFQSNGRLFSVGHSNHEMPRFIELLRGAGVTVVADVRSSPFSRRLPWFSRPELEAGLRDHGIAYDFLGDQLGGRPQALGLYDEDGRVDYEKVRETALFRQGLERLLRSLKRSTVAMLCSEEDPLDCHRGLMIAPALVERGVSPLHLRKDGGVETTAEMEARLLRESRVAEGIHDGLFAGLLTEEERRHFLAEAYQVMARKKAFRLQTEEDGPI